MMNPGERREWIVAYLRKRSRCNLAISVDVLDKAFVDAYIAATGVTAIAMPYGADKTVQLGKDLGDLAKGEHSLLQRTRLGVNGMAGMGMPKWVWSYRFAELAEEPKVAA